MSHFLADRIIVELSGSNPAVLQAHNEAQLVITGLEKARVQFSRHPALITSIELLCENYCQKIREGARPWNEPELLLTLTKLASVRASQEVESLLELVDFHMDLSRTVGSLCESRFVRSPIQRNQIFSKRDSGYVPHTVKIGRSKFGPRILPFVTGLYSEFLDESLYASRDSVYCSDVIPSIDRALLRIKRYSGPLFQDLCKTVRLIVITNDIGRPCYSCRTAYYGGIFINPSFANGLQIAESLIHEFLHQKFWLWWAYDPLASQERLNRLIVSPITGMTRTVEVMLQAALIYRECLSFYAWALQNEPLKEEESWTARRVAHLETGLKALYPILKSEAGSEGRVAAFLDAIVSI